MDTKFIKRAVSLFTLVAFVVTSVPASFAQTLPQPGSMVSLSSAYHPPVLQGVKVYPDDPFRLDFILNKGDVPDEGGGRDLSLQDESQRLIKYFLAALTVPEKDLWVNLSPYEKDRIVPEAFGLTEMGRDLLGQDYLLKQITASVIYPEGETGKKFWAKVYQKAHETYGTTDIPVDTFNKVWIVPDKAVVFENPVQGAEAVAYVVESRLKVMLESDYTSLSHAVIEGGRAGEPSETQELAKNIIREIVIPVLEQEVNEGKNFAALRQVYQSLILAAWYKKKIQESILSKVYVDQKKVQGVNIDDPQEAEKIWAQYVEAFKKGAYNYIKEEKDLYSEEMIPRKYFSGGFDFAMSGMLTTTVDVSLIPPDMGRLLMLPVHIVPEGARDVPSFRSSAVQTIADLKMHVVPRDAYDADPERETIDKIMMGLSQELFQKASPDDLLKLIRRESGHAALRWEDFSPDVFISYAGKGSHKVVYKIRFVLKSGEDVPVVLAVKKEKSKNDISSHELNNLRRLNGRGVPLWGGSFVANDGRMVYVEEFVEGKAIREYQQNNAMDQRLRRQIVETLLTIASALGGMVPRDIHGDNFIVKGSSGQMVMVDIGNKRLSIAGKNATPREQFVFLAVLMAQYGARGSIEDDHWIFDALFAHPLFRDGYGQETLRRISEYLSSVTMAEIRKVLLERAPTMFLAVKQSKDFGDDPLDGFIVFFQQSLDAYRTSDRASGVSGPVNSDYAMTADVDPRSRMALRSIASAVERMNQQGGIKDREGLGYRLTSPELLPDEKYSGGDVYSVSVVRPGEKTPAGRVYFAIPRRAGEVFRVDIPFVHLDPAIRNRGLFSRLSRLIVGSLPERTVVGHMQVQNWPTLHYLASKVIEETADPDKKEVLLRRLGRARDGSDGLEELNKIAALLEKYGPDTEYEYSLVTDVTAFLSAYIRAQEEEPGLTPLGSFYGETVLGKTIPERPWHMVRPPVAGDDLPRLSVLNFSDPPDFAMTNDVSAGLDAERASLQTAARRGVLRGAGNVQFRRKVLQVLRALRAAGPGQEEGFLADRDGFVIKDRNSGHRRVSAILTSPQEMDPGNIGLHTHPAGTAYGVEDPLRSFLPSSQDVVMASGQQGEIIIWGSEDVGFFATILYNPGARIEEALELVGKNESGKMTALNTAQELYARGHLEFFRLTDVIRNGSDGPQIRPDDGLLEWEPISFPDFERLAAFGEKRALIRYLQDEELPQARQLGRSLTRIQREIDSLVLSVEWPSYMSPEERRLLAASFDPAMTSGMFLESGRRELASGRYWVGNELIRLGRVYQFLEERTGGSLTGSNLSSGELESMLKAAPELSYSDEEIRLFVSLVLKSLSMLRDGQTGGDVLKGMTEEFDLLHGGDDFFGGEDRVSSGSPTGSYHQEISALLSSLGVPSFLAFDLDLTLTRSDRDNFNQLVDELNKNKDSFVGVVTHRPFFFEGEGVPDLGLGLYENFFKRQMDMIGLEPDKYAFVIGLVLAPKPPGSTTPEERRGNPYAGANYYWFLRTKDSLGKIREYLVPTESNYEGVNKLAALGALRLHFKDVFRETQSISDEEADTQARNFLHRSVLMMADDDGDHVHLPITGIPRTDKQKALIGPHAVAAHDKGFSEFFRVARVIIDTLPEKGREKDVLRFEDYVVEGLRRLVRHAHFRRNTVKFFVRTDGPKDVDLAQKGGIDFTADRLGLRTAGGGESGVRFNIDPARIQALQNAPGFVPVIMDIQPLDSLPKFLGVKTGAPSVLAAG